MEQGKPLVSLVRQWAPHLHVVSVSNPEPHLQSSNVVATTSDAQAARAAVLELEGEKFQEAQIGLVVLGPTPPEAEDREGVDPEGITRAVVPRAVVGGAIGSAVGA